MKATEGGKPGGKYLVNLQGLEGLEVSGVYGVNAWRCGRFGQGFGLGQAGGEYLVNLQGLEGLEVREPGGTVSLAALASCRSCGYT